MIMLAALLAACGMAAGLSGAPNGPDSTGTRPPPDSVASPSVRECDAPRAGWIWCDDFEEDRLASYFEVDSAGGAFVRVSGVGVNGSSAMRARFAAGAVSAGALHLAVGKTPQAYFRPADQGTAIYRELYWRVYVRTEPGWMGGGGRKLTRAFVFASPVNWGQGAIAHVWSGAPPNQDYLVLDPASGTDGAGTLIADRYNDFDHLRWLGAVRTATPVFSSGTAGRWVCIEVHARLNDPGQSNARFTLWIDGRLAASKSGFDWQGSLAAYGLNAVYLENYWNEGSPKAQERYFDHFVVSTARIGC